MGGEGDVMSPGIVNIFFTALETRLYIMIII